MKINKINHQTQQYQCGLGTSLVNITNGNLRFYYPLIAIGMNNYKIDISLKYNSHYKTTDFGGKKIGFSNGWKLNIHQYVFPYLSSYNIDEFEVGNYVYIDENWNVHRFIKYKSEVIDSILNDVYYDSSNVLLKLYVSNNSIFIKDDYSNKFIFNTNGELTSLVSGINQNVKKLISYDNGNLSQIYDSRKSSRAINFTYTNDLLSKIQTTINNIGFEFDYNGNKLETIFKYSGNIKKEVMTFKYNLNNIMEYSINSNDLNALRYVYTTFKNEPAITKIMYGLVKKEIVPELSSEYYVGDDLYLSDTSEDNKKNYITDKYYKISNFTFLMPISNVKEEVNLTYNDSYTQITNNTGVNLRYYFNIEETTISCLEYKDGNLYSLARIKGHALSGDGASTKKFDGEKINVLSPNIDNKIIYDSDNSKITSFLNSLKNEYGVIKESEKYSEHFNISFWIKFNNNSQTNLIAKVIYSINGSEKYSTMMIENTKVGVWQQVVVPINLGTDQLTLHFVEIQIEGCNPNTEVELTNMIISKGNTSQTYLYSDLGEEYKEFKLDFGQVLQIDGVDYIISPSFYMSSNDFFLTYKNIYNEKKNNEEKFDLIYNNCTKVKTVERLNLKIDNANVYPFVVKNNTSNYYLKTVDIIEDEKYIIIEQQTSFYTDNTTSKNYYEFKTSIGELESVDENTKRLKDESPFITYTWQNEDGTFRAKKSTEKVITENFYDKCGNILKTVVYNDNQENTENEDTTPIETVYNYLENYDYSREHVKSISINGITIQYEYDEDGLLTNLIERGIKTTYNYDIYKEIINSIVNNDPTNVLNEINNNIFYSKAGNVKYMSDGNNCIYGFRYNAFNELCNVYKDKELLYELNKDKTGNNIVETSTLYQDNNKTFVTTKTYDEIGRICSIEHEGVNVNFQYDNDEKSRLISRVKKIEDAFSGDVYNFTYDETNQISEKMEIVNKLEKTIYTDNKVRYKYNDGDQIDFEYRKDNNSNSNIVLTKNSYYSTDNTINNNLSEFTFSYLYDKLGRLAKKAGAPIIYEKCQGCIKGGYDYCGDYDGVVIDKTYSYIPGTVLPNCISYTINSKDKLNSTNSTTGTDHFSTFTYTNQSYDNKGNITKIVEDGTFYEKNPIGIENRTQKYLNTKEYEYSYDSYNRLSKEKNPEFGELNYLYDNTKNELKQVNKNGSLSKLFVYNNGRLTNIYKDGKITSINYDKYGNMLNTDKAVLTYNSRNKLGSYVINNADGNVNNRVSFSYNYQGARYQKRCETLNNGYIVSAKTVNYYLDGNRILREDWIDTNGNISCKLKYFYDNEGVTGIRYDGYNFNLIRDTLGNISKVMYQGKVLGEYIYDAWGNCVIKELNVLDDRERFVLQNNPFRYRGYYYDVETNLALVSSRYYSPELGRFIQPADVSSLNPQSINGLNLYTYAVNNPISFAYNSSVSNVGTAIESVNSSMNSGISNNKLGNLYSNSINIMGGLHALSSAFAFVDQWSGFLSGGLDGGLGYWGPEGFGIQSLGKYSSMVSKFGKGMIIAGSILSWGSSVYNNFNNPNYTMGEAFGASAMDAGYYTAKGVGTYYAGIGVGKAAVGLGIAAGGAAITYLGVGFAGALAIGGGVAVVVGIAGAVAIYYLGELLDYGWSELKKALFE